MSVYLDELPKIIKFYSDENSVIIEFDSDEDFLRLDNECEIELKDIDFLIGCLRSVQNIVKQKK